MPSSAYHELIRSAISHLEQKKLTTSHIFARTQIELPKPPTPKAPAPPKPLPQKKVVEKPKPKVQKPAINLEPIKHQNPSNLTSMQTLLKTLGVPLVEIPPDDKMAKKIKSRWKQRSEMPTVAILIGTESGPQKNLLINLAKAINTCLTPCRAMEVSKIEAPDVFLTHETLEFIIAPDSALQKNLIGHLVEYPGSPKRFLGKKPLLLLPDLKMYLKDPMLKKALWKTLVSALPHSS